MNSKTFSGTLVAVVITGYWISSTLHAASVDDLTKSCTGCHQKDGNSTDPHTPIIAGISKDFFMNSIEAYNSGERPSTIMQQFVKDATEEDVAAMADYYSQQKFQAPKQQFDSAKAQKGKALHDLYCEKCHEDVGRSPDSDGGRLAGQWMPYLQQSMDSFVSGARPMTKKMAEKVNLMVKKDGKESIDLLINYYGSLQ